MARTRSSSMTNTDRAHGMLHTSVDSAEQQPLHVPQHVPCAPPSPHIPEVVVYKWPDRADDILTGRPSTIGRRSEGGAAIGGGSQRASASFGKNLQNTALKAK